VASADIDLDNYLLSGAELDITASHVFRMSDSISNTVTYIDCTDKSPPQSQCTLKRELKKMLQRTEFTCTFILSLIPGKEIF
jgi:hypothetical protein